MSLDSETDAQRSPYIRNGRMEDNEHECGLCRTIRSNVQALNRFHEGDNVFLHGITFEAGSRLSEIQPEVFRECQIEAICIPSRVEKLGSCCFYGSQICSITFEEGDNLVEIGESAFGLCSLRSICIPSSVEVLGDSCFHGSMLSIVTFETGSRLRQIDCYAFSYCQLERICLPASVAVIEEGVFIGCPLKSLDVERGNSNFCCSRQFLMTKDLSEALCPCTACLIYEIPSNVAVIRTTCFHRSRATEFLFEPGCRLREIGEEVFMLCWMAAIRIPSSVEILGDSCFKGSRIVSVTFETGSRLRSIGKCAFDYSLLERICIPSSVDEVKESAFEHCPLISLEVEEDSAFFCTYGKFLLTKDHRELVGPCVLCSDYEIPSTVEIIRDSCFRSRPLTTITFEPGSRLRIIGQFAFCETRLKHIRLPATLEVLCRGCFQLTKLVSESCERGCQPFGTAGKARFLSPFVEVCVPKDCLVDDDAFDRMIKIKRV